MRQNRSHRNNRIARFVTTEVLETRRLLSALPDPVAYPVDSAIPLGGSIPAGQASPPGYSPTQIKTAYGISGVSFNGTAGTGAGQTIAIVVANDNPNFVDSTDPNFDNSDLHKFDLAMGLADPPSFVKVDGNGGTNYPAPDYGWANEIALDVEWTHALAPQANILLVESSSSGLFGLIEGAGNTARSTPGVSVVTMSFAVSEFFGENQYDSFMTTPSGHEGVTFVAASGDNGDPGGYPAFSPNVLSVGATGLNLSNGAYSSEGGHNTSGGGISQYESKPTYQHLINVGNGFRASPDVAFDGDPNTGVSVYDSYNGGDSTPWYKIGGTSFSSPAWAALIAIANQGRATLGLTSLDGPSQTLPSLYELNSADYHDITTGTSIGTTGATAGPGYDFVTGLGTPIANKLIPDLAGGNTVSGVIFNDANGNGVQDDSEVGAAGFTTYLDKYDTNTIVGVDQSAKSASDGTFTFTDLPGGTYTFRTNTPAGWDLTSMSSSFTLTLGFGLSLTGNDIGFRSNGQPAQLAFVQQPSNAVITHDIAPAITVEVENANGDLITTDTSAITLGLASGTGPLSGSLTVNAIGGIATFSDISLPAPDTDVLQATDGNLAPANSNSFVIAATPPDIATQLVFGAQPTGAPVGAVMTPPLSIYLEDANGHVVSTDTSEVTLALAPGSTTNSPTGTLTVNAVNGIARFSNIIFTSSGTAALAASDGALPAITSSTFTAKIVPTKLIFAQSPTPTNTGVPINPSIVVDVADYLGNSVAGDTSAVTLTLTDGGATLGGTTTVNAVNGVATFSNITLPTAGTFTLTATDSTLTNAISGSFAVTPAGSVKPTITHTTLAPSLIAASKIHANVIVSEVPAVTIAGSSSVLTQVYAFGSDGSSTLLATVTRKLSLHAGKKFLVNVPITQVPANLFGTFAIKALVTDPSGDFSPSGVIANVTIAAPFVRLSETVTRLTLPTAVVADSKSHAVALVKIHNGGNIASTGTTTIGIYASPDGLMADAVLINSITRRLSIKPNGATMVTVPLKMIPAGLDGPYTILTQATDPKNQISFNSSGKIVAIAKPVITLSATVGAASPASVAPGKTISVTLTVKNAGNIDSTGSATIALGVSADQATEVPGGTTLLRPMLIKAGKSVTVRLRITVPATVAAGTYSPFVSFTQGANAATAFGSLFTVT